MNPLPRAEAILTACQLLKHARHVVALTGAGISTPSGIPDFRSQGSGLWTRSNPMEVASLTAFRHQPQVFFNWLRPLVKDMRAAQPNPAHLALVELEKKGVLKALITQNIDELHQRAGSINVIPVHGSLNTLSCSRCKKHYPLQDFLEAFINLGEMPHCPSCNSIVKPDIVLYEEILPAQEWSKAERNARRADVFLVIGTSLEVTPANRLPLLAVENGARLIINTLSSTYLDDRAEVILPYDVAEIIPALVEKIQ